MAQEARTGFYRGRQVAFRVIDGLAIYQGDIILGTAEELSGVTKGPPAASGVLAGSLWPDGIIPYTIDTDLPQPQRVLDAIQHWNDNTVVRLAARSTQRNYVRFFHSTAREGVCSSNVGMTGRGEQRIVLEDGCAAKQIIHEIGHAAGLWHEQSRRDRNRFVTVLYENIDKTYADNFDQELNNEEDLGPYDFGSIMHYSATSFSKNGLATLETVPAGMPIGIPDQLSAGDIDAVRRLYGRVADGIVVTAFPRGLQMVVDGVAYPSPQKFAWPLGSTHTLSVPSPQGAASTRYSFGQWSDGGALEHTITVNGTDTIYAASFLRQFRMNVVQPGGRGTLLVSPSSPDGFHTDRSFIELTGVADPDSYFLEWNGLQSGSANPKVFNFRSGGTISATFSPVPPVTIASSPPARRVIVDGFAYTAPQNFAWTPGSAHTLETNSVPGDTVRYAFRDWSDGGARSHIVQAPSGLSTIIANFTPQYLLEVTASPSRGGIVLPTPASVDGFYDGGSIVQLTATPNPGFALAAWTGDAAGRTNPYPLPMTEQRRVIANFASASNISGIVAVSAASFLADPIAPGEIVTLFGSGLGPADPAGLRVTSGKVDTLLADTRVLFDGVAAPLIYVSDKQTSAVVPYALAGRTGALVQVEYKGVRTNPIGVQVAASAPALFTANSSGTGQGAILNQDYSPNSANNPARRGSVVQIFATGEGVTTPAGVDGKVSAEPLPRPRLPVSVRIGGREAAVLYAGAAPSLVAGVLQVNALVPDGIQPGPEVPVSLVIGDNASPPGVTVAVQ